MRVLNGERHVVLDQETQQSESDHSAFKTSFLVCCPSASSDGPHSTRSPKVDEPDQSRGDPAAHNPLDFGVENVKLSAFLQLKGAGHMKPGICSSTSESPTPTEEFQHSTSALWESHPLCPNSDRLLGAADRSFWRSHGGEVACGLEIGSTCFRLLNILWLLFG